MFTNTLYFRTHMVSATHFYQSNYYLSRVCVMLKSFCHVHLFYHDSCTLRALIPNLKEPETITNAYQSNTLTKTQTKNLQYTLIKFVSLAYPGRNGVYICCGRDGHPVCAVRRSASQHPWLHRPHVGARNDYLQPLQVGGRLINIICQFPD